MENELGKPGTSRDEPVMVGEVEYTNKQFATVAVVDDSLIHQDPVLPESARAASDSAPQPFRHGNGDIGMSISEGVSRNYNIPAHI
jgi:hypothetical protein